MLLVDQLKMKAKLLVKAKKKAGAKMALKDALDVMARMAGFATWRALRSSPREEDLYARGTGVFPHHWCKTYEEARGVLAANGGVLMPFKQQFFVCRVEHVEGLGIARDDADFVRVGNDWAKPRDEAALKRINAKIRQIATASSK